jgi:8-oxo-dGTP pyrophosphatase MutT (NUDIX family)
MKGNYCKNCNCIGHTYNQCRHPITSYGIILINRYNGKILLSQRRQSLSLIELLKGRYVRNDYNFIEALFRGLTVYERDLIIRLKFDYLKLYAYCFGNSSKFYTKNKNKFDSLFGINEYVSLLRNLKVKEESQWGFPKGRININESPLDCSIREFHEETSIPLDRIEIQNIKPLTEVFFGTNGRMYKHTYYIAYTEIDSISSKIKAQLSGNIEIKQIQFFTINEAIDLTESYYKKRINLLHRLKSLLTTTTTYNQEDNTARKNDGSTRRITMDQQEE